MPKGEWRKFEGFLMPDLSTDLVGSSATNALFVVAAFAPGLVILWTRSLFLTGRLTSVANAAIEYLVVSSIYYSLAAPLVLKVNRWNWFLLEALFLFAPLLCGLVVAGLSQWNWPRKIAATVGLNPVTPHPTGWDKAFGSLEGEVWLIVHTADLGVVHGRFGDQSNASTLLDRRDIYLEDMRDEEFDHIGSDKEDRGVWIPESQIRSVEIISTKAQA